jgi:hypothetical protein
MQGHRPAAAASGADIFAFQPPGLAVGGPFAVIGFLQFAMGLGHESLSRIATTAAQLVSGIQQFTIPGRVLKGQAGRAIEADNWQADCPACSVLQCGK